MTVYFIKAENNVKIGYSSKPMKRVKTLQTSSPYPLEVLFFMPGSSATEKELHRVFNSYHKLNEWYEIKGNLTFFIDAASSIFSDYTNKIKTNEEYQDERDWEYWRNRALKAESTIKSSSKEKVIKKTPEKYYECVCGRSFGGSRSYNAHRSHCEIPANKPVRIYKNGSEK